MVLFSCIFLGEFISQDEPTIIKEESSQESFLESSTQSQWPFITQQINSSHNIVQQSSDLTHNESSIRKLLFQNEEKDKMCSNAKSDISSTTWSEEPLKTESIIDDDAIRKMLIEDDVQQVQSSREKTNVMSYSSKAMSSKSDHVGKSKCTARKTLGGDETHKKSQDKSARCPYAKSLDSLSSEPLGPTKLKTSQVVDIMFKLLTVGSVRTLNEGEYCCPFLKYLENMQASFSKVIVSTAGKKSEFELVKCKTEADSDYIEKSTSTDDASNGQPTANQQVGTGKEIVATKSDPALDEDELDATKTELDATKTELDAIKSELDATRDEPVATTCEPEATFNDPDTYLVQPPATCSEPMATDAQPLFTNIGQQVSSASSPFPTNIVPNSIMIQPTGTKYKPIAPKLTFGQSFPVQAIQDSCIVIEDEPAKAGHDIPNSKKRKRLNLNVNKMEITPKPYKGLKTLQKAKKNMGTFKWKTNMKKAKNDPKLNPSFGKLSKKIGTVERKKRKKRVLGKNGTFVCRICNREYIFQTSYKKHLKMHEEGKTKLGQRNFLDGKQKSSSEKGKVDPVECKICHKEFASHASLKLHHRTTHEVSYYVLVKNI